MREFILLVGNFIFRGMINWHYCPIESLFILFPNVAAVFRRTCRQTLFDLTRSRATGP